MSKIKDLLAETEGIEDLMPVNRPSIQTIAGAAVKHVTDYGQDVYEQLYEDAELSYDEDEEGHKRLFMSNYDEICENIADCGINHVIEDWQLDLTHDEYRKVLAVTTKIIADTYHDFEDKVVKELKEEQKEEQAQRESYDNLTLPKE